jgi:hypothetical protein
MCGFGLYVGCSYMAGSIARGINDSLIGILGESRCFGAKVGLRRRIVMVGANEMYG